MNKIYIILFCILWGTSTFYGMKRHLDTSDIFSKKPIKKINFSTTQKNENLLHTTVRRNDLVSTKQLLDNGANINSIYAGVTPLKIAIQNQHIDMIELLLNYNPENKCFPEVFKTNNVIIIQRYCIHPKITSSDLNIGYQQALTAMMLSANTSETILYKSAAQLFIEYYNSLEEQNSTPLSTGNAHQQIVTTADISSTIVRDVNKKIAIENAEKYLES